MRHAVLADTGPLYAAADPDDSYHQRAHTQLKRLARERYVVMVAYPTLLEAHSLILHRLGMHYASKWLEEVLIGARVVNPSPDDYVQAVAKIAAFPDQRITLFDAIVAVLAQRLGAEVWTYDHHFDIMRNKIWR